MKYLSPKACADMLSVTGAFIRGEIRDQRLKARVFTRQSGRCLYRIEPEDFRAYVEEHWPAATTCHVERLENTANTRNTENPM